MKKNNKTKNIVGVGIFIAMVVVLQMIANNITLEVSITLSLIPIVIGSIVYGPLAGFILGVVNGVVILLSPQAQAFFLINVPLTVLIVTLKTGIAGLLSGLIYKLINPNMHYLAIILASISVPIVNTGIFTLSMLFVYRPLLESLVPEGDNAISFLFLSFIGINFTIEFFINSTLSPVILRIVDYTRK